jgi:beta-xylosidase
MKWNNDWPVIGIDEDGDGIGEPVSVYKKPLHDKKFAVITPPESDEFNTGTLGLQWQWHANPQIHWAFPTAGLGYLRLFAADKPKDAKSLWDVPSLLMQKFSAPEFTATAKITFKPRLDGDKVGLVVMGRDYAYVGLERKENKLWFVQATCTGADKQQAEVRSEIKETTISEVYLRVRVDQNANCQFSFSEDGKKFKNAGELFQAREGMWIGAKVGLFCLRDRTTNDSGSADVDWFRIEP